MNIAVFYNVSPGGAKRAVYEEIKYLSKNHTISLYEYQNSNEDFLDVRLFCKNIYTYDFNINSGLPGFIGRIKKDVNNFYFLDKLHKKIAQEIDNKNYDVVLVHPDRFTQAPFLLKHLKTPTLYFCEEYLRMVYEKQFEFVENVVFYKKWYEIATRKIRKKIDMNNASSADLVVANSKFTKNNIEKAYDISVHHCHLGVDTDVFVPSRKLKKKKYILFIGGKLDKVGYEFARNALEKISPKIRPKLVILGFSGGKLKIQNDTLLSKEYSNAIATICTSENEPFGIAPLESMSCETPVLAVSEGGYKETVVNEKTGYLLPRDAKKFSSKIEFLIKSPISSKKMGEAGRKHVINNFTWDKHSKSIEKYLVELSKTNLR